MDELNSIDEVLNQYQSQQFTTEDEEALAKELDDLMKEPVIAEEKLPSLPKVPNNTIPQTNRMESVELTENEEISRDKEKSPLLLT